MDDLIKKYQEKLPEKIISDIVESMPKKATKKQQEEIFQKTFEEYENAQIEAGEAIGLIASSSFGERSTQMTLHSKHFGGVSKIQVSSGLPRLIEIFDGRKELSQTSMEVYFVKKKLTEKEVKNYAIQIKETKLTEFVKEFELDFINQEVKCHLNAEKVQSDGVTPEELAEMLQKHMKSIKVTSQGNALLVKRKVKDEKIMDLYKLKDKLKTAFISGIKNVKDVMIVKEDNGEFKIVTNGSNFKEIMKLEFVDKYRTTTNDIYQIYLELGVEAARTAIIDEIEKVLNGQGLDVDIRHLMLVADTMTLTGKIRGITRYGIVLDKDSVISKAAFETPMRHIFYAAITGQKDLLKSVIENVMINQPAPIGTGMTRLLSTIKP